MSWLSATVIRSISSRVCILSFIPSENSPSPSCCNTLVTRSIGREMLLEICISKPTRMSRARTPTSTDILTLWSASCRITLSGTMSPSDQWVAEWRILMGDITTK